MKFEQIDFNESFWKGKSRAEFIAHEKHQPLSQKQLNEAFDLMNPTGNNEEEDDESDSEPEEDD